MTARHAPYYPIRAWRLIREVTFADGYRRRFQVSERPGGGVFCLAFRGAAPPEEKTGEWLKAFTAVKKSFPFGPGRVHAGFLKIYLEEQEAIMAEVEKRKNTFKALFLGGFSLGGPLSTMAAVDIAQEYPEMYLLIYTFGSPRVGNNKFRDFYDNLMRNHPRTVVDGDNFTNYFKAWSGYRHVAHEYRFPKYPVSGSGQHYLGSYQHQIRAEVEEYLDGLSDAHRTSVETREQIDDTIGVGSGLWTKPEGWEKGELW